MKGKCLLERCVVGRYWRCKKFSKSQARAQTGTARNLPSPASSPARLFQAPHEARQPELAGGGRNWFLPLVLTGLNRVAETPCGKNWQKLAKTQMTKTVCFLVSNCLQCTNVCMDVIGTYCAHRLIGFLVGDYLKCPYMFLVTIGMCLSAC